MIYQKLEGPLPMTKGFRLEVAGGSVIKNKSNHKPPAVTARWHLVLLEEDKHLLTQYQDMPEWHMVMASAAWRSTSTIN